MGNSIRQVGKDYGLGKPKFVRGGRWQEGPAESPHESDGEELLKGSNVRPVQVGQPAPRREIGQGLESVEDMIARCLAGEGASTVVESVLSGEKDEWRRSVAS